MFDEEKRIKALVKVCFHVRNVSYVLTKSIVPHMLVRITVAGAQSDYHKKGEYNYE